LYEAVKRYRNAIDDIVKTYPHEDAGGN
jgi:hypothetical protein